MDLSGPVGRRTRAREAVYFKELHDKIKGKKKICTGYGGGDGGGGDGGGGGGRGRGKRGKRRRKGLDVVEIGAKKNVGLRRVDSSDFLDVNDDGLKEMEVEESGDGDDDVLACNEEGDDDDGVEFLGFDGWGPKSPKKLKTGGENFENAISIPIPIPIEVVSSEDEVEVIGERGEGGFSFVSSSLKSGSCSKVGGEKGEKFDLVDVDEVVSPSHEMGANNDVEVSGGNSSSGVAERAQMQLGDSEKNQNVDDLQFADLEELESSSYDGDSEDLEESSTEDNDDSADEDFRMGDRSWEQPTSSESEEGEDVNVSNVTRRGSNDDTDDEDFRMGDQRLEQPTPSESEVREGVDVSNVMKRGSNADTNDEDFRVGDQRLEQPTPSESEEGEDVDDSNVMKRGSNDEEGREKDVMVGLKRRKAYGLDVLVDSRDEGNSINTTQGPNCVARRTRSHFDSKVKEKIMNLGTVSRPLCINEEEADEKEQDSSCEDDDGGGDGNGSKNQAKRSEKTINSRNGNVDHFLQEEGGRKYEEEIGKSTKRKRVRAPKKLDFITILLDSILNESNEAVEELVSSRCGILDQETSPPLIATWKFLYPVKDSNPTEESEDEEEHKSMWIEFDFALRSSEIDSSDSFMMDNEDSTTPDVKSDPATLCSQGKHQFIIDEEVGLICKYCSFVDLEMKHISPTFDKQAWRRLQGKDYSEMDSSTFNEHQFQNSGCDSQLSSDLNVHAKGTVWEIVPGMKSSMYRHQREGFEFIWKIIAGGIYLQELKSSKFTGGSGCVISHAPGTGKTRLILAFLQSYLGLYPTCKPLIIAPRSMLLTWEEQCKMWNFPMPFHNLNNNELSGKENLAVLKLLREAKHQDRSVDINRMAKIYSWVQGKSILGLSYRLFEILVSKGEVADKEGTKNCKIRSRADSNIRKILLELPGLLVLDEGHTPRNDQSLIWKALSKIQTEKRIILSGTPFQNNFEELYNTLCVVRPKFAETILIQSGRRCNDFQSKGGRNINVARGKWVSLTNSIGKNADHRLEELRAMIDPFVHVHKGNILQESLPGLRDSVVVLQPTNFQKSLLEGVQGLKNPLELGHIVSLISAHPSLLLVCPSEKEKSIVEKDKLKRLRLNPDAGVKTKFLMELIRLSGAMNEKVLVFSQYIDPLNLIRDQLKSHFKWIEGKEVLYMDGKRDVKERQSSINVFNEITSEARVLLASTRACSEGINLIGASRVVLLDVVWNPSVERQAISRAYRLGQKRVVYIYHLITAGTIEGEKYCRQAEKDRLSGLVFSSTNDCNGQKISDTVSDDKILEEMVQHVKLRDMFEKIIYQPKESDLIETFGPVSPANM